MNQSVEMIPIAHSDDKHQVTAVLAASLNWESMPPQIIYQGKTTRCHPTVTAVPQGWDLWHSENLWSNGKTMESYVEKLIVFYLNEKRAALKLEKSHPALAIFDCFCGQSTTPFFSLLKKHNIIAVQIPANYTDHLQPLDVSVNKPFKDQVKKSFQM
uniref:DDE-1 domain-containing protein n=1 Tax=Amphimedon queenslandica TaxID=400682 RepID=A0A1X7T019_AMPQE